MAEVDFSGSKSIYMQIMESIKKKIMTGELQCGEKIATVRELAAEYEVNPNTMQRALSELERELFLYSERTTGRYVTKDETLIKKAKEDYVGKLIEKFLEDLAAFGYTKEAVIQIITEVR